MKYQQDSTLLKIKVAKNEMILHPYRALFWLEQATLIVADLHLGKIQHFRDAGIYLPKHAALDNYERLSSLLLEFEPERLLMLGDLFHSSYNRDWMNFCELRNSFKEIRFELVPGNHDIVDFDLFTKNDVTLHKQGLVREDFFFSHYPNQTVDLYNIAGHLHPGIRLVGDGMPSMTLAAFYFGPRAGVLPSFGTFTGVSIINPEPGDQVIAISGEQLFFFGED